MAEIDYNSLYRRLEEAEKALLGSGTNAGTDAAVLRARAESLAKAPEENAGATLSVLTFSVGGGRFALPVDDAKRVANIRGLTALPGATKGVLGAMFLHGRVTVVMDLRAILSLGGGGMSDLKHVLVLEVGDQTVALAVERVDERLDLLDKNLQAPPAGPYEWMTEDGVLCLSKERLFERKDA